MAITVTIHLWWLLAYLVTGAVLWLPLEFVFWRSIHNPDPFWRELTLNVKRRPYAPFTTTLLWPLAVWEAIR